ncbi:cytochrome c3 family protein [Chengkuizengella sp. SCS-71B]|uniref:cytochrome c3 family protein n=1 Tax=Chengkuizengella sp. SCS-71B TaxID=3115290 RepID=UPI0032C245B5
MFKKIKALDKRLILFIGILLGLIFTVASAETLHYTDSAEFCSTCHPMDTAYSSFSDSIHANLDCNTCHAPTDNFVEKILFKSKAGLHDIYMNTLNVDEIPDVIHAKAATVEVVQENCVSCHENSINNVSHNVKSTCVECHRQVPHGKKDKIKSEQLYEPGTYNIKGINESRRE